MIDITPVTEAVIMLLAAMISRKLIPWLQVRLTIQQQEMLQAVTRTMVYAAEQIYGAGNGAKKLQYVQEQLEERGFCVDLAQIEASVRAMADGTK